MENGQSSRMPESNGPVSRVQERNGQSSRVMGRNGQGSRETDLNGQSCRVPGTAALPDARAPDASVQHGGISRLNNAETPAPNRQLHGNTPRAGMKNAPIKRLNAAFIAKAPTYHASTSLGKRTRFAFEHEPEVAMAFFADAPFPTPPSHAIPSKAELVDGLLTHFDVPVQLEGPLPVITQVETETDKLPKTI